MTFVELWPIISGFIAIGAVAIAFRAEVLVRIKVLEDKIVTVFQFFNEMNKRK